MIMDYNHHNLSSSIHFYTYHEVKFLRHELLPLFILQVQFLTVIIDMNLTN